MTGSQKSYIVTGKELLIIVETMKYFRTVLLGQKIKVYVDHKKLSCNFLIQLEY